MIPQELTPNMRALYIAVPKTGSAGLSQTLAIDDNISPDHSPFVKLNMKLNLMGVDTSSLFIFCSCRNPYQRFKSWAYDFDDRVYKALGIEDWMNTGMSLNDLAEAFYNFYKLAEDGYTLEKRDGTEVGIPYHVRTQYSFIVNEDGDPVVDFLIKLESIEGDWDRLTEILKDKDIILKDKSFLNRKKGTRTRIKTNEREELTEASKKKLSELYAKDFEFFGYDKEVDVNRYTLLKDVS